MEYHHRVSEIQLESNFIMSTSNSNQQHFLDRRRYSPAVARKLLADWANIPADYFEGIGFDSSPDPGGIRRVDSAIKRLMTHYPEVFSSVADSGAPQLANAESEITTAQWRLAAEVQRYIRHAWEASDLRTREWFIFKARDKYHWQTVVLPMIDKRLRAATDVKAELEKPVPDEEETVRHGPPALTEFERAMYLFQRISDRARRCPNPDCPAPFFFARRKNQRYCTEKCAADALREQKRKWWSENRAR
jgi:hypothetical protein